MISIDPKLYGPYVVYEKGEPATYVLLEKALYGTLRAARMFYELLKKTLLEWGFTINPHDPYVANKMVNGKQHTLIWHVDDLKISHFEYDVVMDMINMLSDKFGKLAPLNISRGKHHNYLGMTLDFSDKGKVKVKMIDYVAGMLEWAKEEHFPNLQHANTPAREHHFAVDPD